MEGWTTQIDIYCERTDFAFWAEPVNAWSNLAFIVAALWMWRRLQGHDMPLARALCVVMAAIGTTSFLWHTIATQWSVTLDVLSIAVFVFLYIYVANREYWRLSPWMAGFATGAAIPYMAVVGPAFGALPFFEISSIYWPIALLIAFYALALWRREPETARGLALGSGVLVVSLVFRSLDEAVCDSFSVGTHFMWHALNGVMLGWMIEVYRRHRVRTEAAG